MRETPIAESKKEVDSRVRIRNTEPNKHTHIKILNDGLELELFKQSAEELSILECRIVINNLNCYLNILQEDRFTLLRAPSKIAAYFSKEN